MKPGRQRSTRSPIRCDENRARSHRSHIQKPEEAIEGSTAPTSVSRSTMRRPSASGISEAKMRIEKIRPAQSLAMARDKIVDRRRENAARRSPHNEPARKGRIEFCVSARQARGPHARRVCESDARARKRRSRRVGPTMPRGLKRPLLPISNATPISPEIAKRDLHCRIARQRTGRGGKSALDHDDRASFGRFLPKLSAASSCCQDPTRAPTTRRRGG